MGSLNRSRNQGFAVMELSVTALVISLAALVIVPMQNRGLERERLAEADATLNCIRTHLNAYHHNFGHYPQGTDLVYVLGSEWNVMEPQALSGKYFDAMTYMYRSNEQGSIYTITCFGVDLAGNSRVVDETGTFRFE